jgi:hypothetical protein
MKRQRRVHEDAGHANSSLDARRGDTVFFLGAVAIVIFVAGLKTGHSIKKGADAS